ncbi:MAG: TIGR02206 family membrane protein [Propionibacteriaceae bacterium]|nr:TIGR02206 family membrane protein [Propionibacteriaceae bacterium]
MADLGVVENVFDVLFTRDVSPELRWTWGDAAHWVYMVASLVVVVFALRYLKRLPEDRHRKAILWLAGLAFSMWIIPPVILCVTDTGERWIEHLPLHLCSAACIIIPIGLLTRNKTVLGYVYGLCFPGAVMAIVTPGAMYRSLSYLGFHYWMYNVSHVILIVAGLAPIAMGWYKPSWRQYLPASGIGTAWLIVDYPINKLLDTNYLFVNIPEPGTPIAAMADLAGVPGYIGILAALAYTVIAALFAAWSLIAWVARRRAPLVGAQPGGGSGGTL